MSVVTVINRKGGSGKSTLAAHVAVAQAQRGRQVMLADIDPQQSLVPWLKRRAGQDVQGQLQGWAKESRHVLRPPAGTDCAVIDTPGGVQGFDLARLLVYADVVLMPVCDSIFDRESAAACLKEMRTHPRVASRRVSIGVVGMRLGPEAAAELRLRTWAVENGVEFIGALRYSPAYAECAAHGLTVLDQTGEARVAAQAEWAPVVTWLEAALAAQKALAHLRGARALGGAPSGHPREPVRAVAELDSTSTPPISSAIGACAATSSTSTTSAPTAADSAVLVGVARAISVSSASSASSGTSASSAASAPRAPAAAAPGPRARAIGGSGAPGDSWFQRLRTRWNGP